MDPFWFCRAPPPPCTNDSEDQDDAVTQPQTLPSNVVKLEAKPWRPWISTGLWSAVVRPPRQPADEDLQKMNLYAVFRSHGACFYERHDVQIQNNRGLMLQCSHFVPMEASSPVRPCVVYLHGSSSNRFEVHQVLKHLLTYDVTVFCFDFAGSGQSEGDYVSLGYYEEQDLRAVLDHLRRSEGVSSIGLWGWSMGAVAALLRASEDSSVSACVLDSPFADFTAVATEQVRVRAPFLPKMLADFAVNLVLDEARLRHHGFDPNALKPIAYAQKASIPAMFGVARHDQVTPPHHTEELHDKWGGHKCFYTFDGGHCTTRPQWFLEKASLFLVKSFKQCAAGATEDTRVFPLSGSPDHFKQIRKILIKGKRPTPHFVAPQNLNDEADAAIMCVAEPQGLPMALPTIVSC